MLCKINQLLYNLPKKIPYISKIYVLVIVKQIRKYNGILIRANSDHNLSFSYLLKISAWAYHMPQHFTLPSVLL